MHQNSNELRAKYETNIFDSFVMGIKGVQLSFSMILGVHQNSNELVAKHETNIFDSFVMRIRRVQNYTVASVT